MLIPGTDGEKMSKSKNNTIDVFEDEKKLKKIINKNIITDDTPLDLPKDPDSSNLYQLFCAVAEKEQASNMAKKLKAGGYGWGHAKKELLDLINIKFSHPREKFLHYMNNKSELDLILEEGSIKAKSVASKTMERVRNTIGY